jgi:hypothetical protein
MLSKIKQNGGDLRLSEDEIGDNELPKELVKFDKTTGDLTWSTFPSVAEGLFYHVWANKPAAVQPAVDEAFGSQAVWVDYAVVSHDTFTESTGNPSVIYNGAISPVVGVFGNAGGGGRQNVSADNVVYTGISVSSQWTLQAWVIPETQNGRFVSLGQIGSTGNQANLQTSSGGVLEYDRNGADPTTGTTFINESEYSFFAARESSGLGNLIWVNDGTFSQTLVHDSSFPTLNRAAIFVSADDTPFGRNPQTLSEIRISKLALEDSHLAIEYQNQSATGAWWIATDEAAPNATPTVSITASSLNTAAGEVVTLRANVVDDDAGDSHTYLWSSGETTQSITITAPTSSSASTIYREVVANDGTENSNTANVTVNVAAEEVPNAAPTASITASTLNAAAGEVVTLTANVVDEDAGDSHTYLWSSGETTQSITITAPTSSSSSTIYREVVANDGTENSNTANVTVNIAAEEVPNATPTVSITASKLNAAAGESVTLTANVVDDDAGDSHTYLWSSGETTQAITITAPTNSSASTIYREVFANDGTENSNTANVTVNVAAEEITSTAVFTLADASNLSNVAVSIWSVSPRTLVTSQIVNFDGEGNSDSIALEVASGVDLMMTGWTDTVALAIESTSAVNGGTESSNATTATVNVAVEGVASSAVFTLADASNLSNVAVSIWSVSPRTLVTSQIVNFDSAGNSDSIALEVAPGVDLMMTGWTDTVALAIESTSVESN